MKEYIIRLIKGLGQRDIKQKNFSVDGDELSFRYVAMPDSVDKLRELLKNNKE
ncbi:MAG: hypothetical protein OEV92_09410 [Nitrospinota bacterium]|nr:hypothetical protein [Nitrospinota bacterium]